MRFPLEAIGNQHLTRRFRVGTRPQHKQPHRVVDFWKANSLREIPLGMIADGELRADEWAKRRDPLTHRHLLPADRDHAIELQVAKVTSTVPLDMVHDWPVGEIAVEGEVARNRFGDDPINQLFRQLGVIVERMGVIALLTLAEAPKVERVVLAGGVDIVDEQIVVGNQVTLVSVIPKPANIIDQFAIVANQGVVNWNDTVLAVACGRVMLEPLEALVIQALGLPGRLGQEAVEARLVGGIGKLTCDTADRLVFDHQQPGDVLSKVNARWLIGEDVPKLYHQFFHDLGQCNDRWHRTLP